MLLLALNDSYVSEGKIMILHVDDKKVSFPYPSLYDKKSVSLYLRFLCKYRYNLNLSYLGHSCF